MLYVLSLSKKRYNSIDKLFIKFRYKIYVNNYNEINKKGEEINSNGKFKR